jgi:succinoglycan biosynthesis transport protein ExoP
VNRQFHIPSEPVQDAAPDRGANLREYVAFAWRHWIFIASMTALALLFGLVWLAYAVPLYTATAQVMLDPLTERAPVQNNTTPNVFFIDPAMMENQISLIRSDGLLRRVVEKNKLYSVGSANKEAAQTSGWDAFKEALSGKPASPVQPAPAPTDDPSAEEKAISAAVERLRAALGVQRTGLGYILSISVTDPDPDRAALLANAVADAYVVNKLDARLEGAKRASGWLSDRLVELREQLKQAEEAVAQFRIDNGLVRAGSSVTLTEQQLSELNGELLRARQDAEVKRTRLQFLEKALQTGSRQSLPNIFQSGAMVNLQSRLTEISGREADLLARYSGRHPAVVNLQAEKRDVERAMAAEAQRQIDTIKTEAALADARVTSTEQALKEATGQTGVDDRTAVRLRELERTATVNKTLFEEFLQKAKVTDSSASFEVRDARVLFAAKTPWVASYPSRNRILALAAAMGLAIGLLGAFGMEKLKSGFMTPREIEDRLRLPVLGSISRMSEAERTIDGMLLSLPAYQLKKPLSRFSEAIRTLRTGIQMTDVDRPPKVIQVTSTRPGEGKTTIALSLAVSAAQAGQRVLIIDADLRHPSTSKYFGREKDAGLVNVLTGDADLRDVLSFDEGTRVFVIPAGGKTQNPPDLLGSEKMKALLAALRRNFEYIIVDTPPMGPVVDPKVVSLLCDKTVYVVHWGTTAREIVETSIQQFPNSRQVAGIVLNMVNEGRAQKYGRDGSTYYYGQRYYGKYYSG